MTASEVLTTGMESTIGGAVVPAESLTAKEVVTTTSIGKVADRRLIEVVAVSFSDWMLP